MTQAQVQLSTYSCWLGNRSDARLHTTTNQQAGRFLLTAPMVNMSASDKRPYIVLSPSLRIGGTAFPAALPTLLRHPFGIALDKPNVPLLECIQSRQLYASTMSASRQAYAYDRLVAKVIRTRSTTYTTTA